ncbi:MAG: sigma-54-dependent Fis family transcriptional regulator, partial [Myxococcales bacterium]
MMKKILFVDDDRAMADYVAEALRRVGYEMSTTDSAAGALEAIERGVFDLVVTDVRMRRDDGIDLCRRLTERAPDLPVLVVTAFGNLDTAIAALRAGAEDFLPKPFELEQLQFAIERALRHRELKREVRRLREITREPVPRGLLLGDSAPMRRVADLIERIADVDTTALVLGESGTGKELVARSLHEIGRPGQPYVAVNCAAMPETLLESELFGHVRGAFTDAKGSRDGLLVQAGRGTVFLDEIGEMTPAMQAKLLRVLQERTVRPVGGSAEVVVQARVVAATHRDLEEEVEAGRFREDLFYRLNVLPVVLPPLRARGNDVLLLAQHFLRQVAGRTGRPVQGLEPSTAERLLAYPWPGNVRELQNAIERAVVLTRHDHLTVVDLPERVQQPQARRAVLVGDEPTELISLEEVERRYILHVLQVVGGKKSEAAGILGLDRKTLYRKLARYDGEGSRDGGKLTPGPPALTQ